MLSLTSQTRLLSLIALNAPTLNAQLQGSAQSTTSSASPAQDFSAILTELVGSGPINPINSAALSQNPGPLPINSAASSQNPGQLPNVLAADMTQGAAAKPISSDKAAQAANAQKVQQTCEPEQLKTKESPDSKKTGESQKPHDLSQPNQTLV